MTEREQIEKLRDGECYVVPESDYGKAEIWYKNEMYFLFEIPIFGGLPMFHSCYSKFDIQEMIDKYNSWT